MKISMVRRADALGRVVLPEEIRNALGIAEGTSVRLTLDGGRAALEKETPQCALFAAPPKTCASREKAQFVRNALTQLQKI